MMSATLWVWDSQGIYQFYFVRNWFYSLIWNGSNCLISFKRNTACVKCFSLTSLILAIIIWFCTFMCIMLRSMCALSIRPSCERWCQILVLFWLHTKRTQNWMKTMRPPTTTITNTIDIRICSNNHSNLARVANMPVERYASEYNMKHGKRGMAIIFNHEHFEVLSLKSRAGTNVDCENLKNTLDRLHFDVTVYKDYRFNEIQQKIEECKWWVIVMFFFVENRNVYKWIQELWRHYFVNDL